MRTGSIEIDGGTLETAWWGAGQPETPTLVLLHEGLGSVGLWRDLPERLAASTGLNVFAYSRFGYGFSDPVPLPRPVTYMHHEAQVVLPQVLRLAGIKDAVLIGHSDGGSIAAIYAGHAAGAAVQLRGVVMIAAHFTVEEVNIESIRQIRQDYETKSLRDRLARHHRDVDVAFFGWNDAWLDPRFRAFDITDFLSAIKVPVLALQGEDDPYGTTEQLRILEASVPVPVTTRLIAGARHSPHLEAKDATLAAVADFIAGLSRDFAE